MEGIFEKLPRQALVHQKAFAFSETPNQEFFKVVWKPKRAWFFLRQLAEKKSAGFKTVRLPRGGKRMVL